MPLNDKQKLQRLVENLVATGSVPQQDVDKLRANYEQKRKEREEKSRTDQKR